MLKVLLFIGKRLDYSTPAPESFGYERQMHVLQTRIGTRTADSFMPEAILARVTPGKQIAMLNHRHFSKRVLTIMQAKATQFGIIKFGVAVSLLTLLAACAAPNQTTLSDGTTAYRIDCGSTSAGLNYCFERAGKSCGAAGYTIVDREGRMVSRSGVAGSDAEALVRKYEADKNSIYVKCGG